MDTVKTLVAFCHLQRAAYSVQCTTCNVNTAKLWSCVTKHTVKGKHCWFIVPLRRLPCHVNYIISLPVWLLAAPAATPTRLAAPRAPTWQLPCSLGVQNFCCPAAVTSSSLHSPYTSEEHMTGHTARMCNVYSLLLVFHSSIDYSTLRSLNIDTNLMLNIPTAAA